ncbi:hypothetical protein EDC90_101785 [Martelella mediterranea]|uniref:Uncharacterized protein n=1 Tax=Martelella mediterranea TaxID=293089 RepID=A0A4V2V463_9HYPH|nr:hypothetical protein EDC90_101785 [Martelella mediterranea]
MNDQVSNGLPVKGYRPQQGDKIATVNHNKELEERVWASSTPWLPIPISTSAGWRSPARRSNRVSWRQTVPCFSLTAWRFRKMRPDNHVWRA